MAVRWFYWKEEGEGLLGRGAKRRARGFGKRVEQKGAYVLDPTLLQCV